MQVKLQQVHILGKGSKCQGGRRGCPSPCLISSHLGRIPTWRLRVPRRPPTRGRRAHARESPAADSASPTPGRMRTAP